MAPHGGGTVTTLGERFQGGAGGQGTGVVHDHTIVTLQQLAVKQWFLVVVWQQAQLNFLKGEGKGEKCAM